MLTHSSGAYLNNTTVQIGQQYELRSRALRATDGTYYGPSAICTLASKVLGIAVNLSRNLGWLHLLLLSWRASVELGWLQCNLPYLRTGRKKQ